MSINFGNGSIQFKIDTGSEVNILPSACLHNLGFMGPLEKPHNQLSAYSGDQLKVHGTALIIC